MRRAFLSCLIALCFAVAALPALAQSSGFMTPRPAEAAATPGSPEASRDRLARLSDAEVRELLLERLDRDAAEAAAEPGGLEALGATAAEAAMGFAASISGAIARVPNLGGGIAEGLGRFWGPRGWLGTAHLVAVGLLALGLGRIAEWLLGRLFADLQERLRKARPTGLADRLGLLSRRLALEAGGVIVFIATAWLVIALAHPAAVMSYLILWFLLFVPVLYIRLTAAVTRFVLAPERPELRLVAMADADARFLHWALIAFAALVGLRSYALSFLGGHGVDLADIRLGFWLTLAIYGWLLYVAWRHRAALTGMLIGDDVTAFEARLARSYPSVAMLLITLVWMLNEVFVGLGLWHLLDSRLPLTLAILVFAPVLDIAIRGVVRHVAPGLIDAEGVPEATLYSLRRSLVRIGRTIALGLILLVLLDIWNVGLGAPEMGSFAARLAGRLVEATAVAATGYLVLEVVTFWITRRLAAEGPPPGQHSPLDEAGGEGGAAGGSRLSTVLPLIRRGVQVAIIVVTGLAVLSALGVSTTPLLAGAGIVGLAIGFGAQKLVADIVSGLFFLIDDAFRIGEYVEIEDTRGTVERISVRSLQMRHHLGAVHTIPFGEIPKLTNYSRDWVIMKLRFTVPFDTDLMKVKKLFKVIGQELIADPAFADDFLQPFKSQGVLEVDDIGIVIRGKFMARPGRQWVLRKEIYQRIQEAFEKNGIQFARREVRVRIDQPAAGTPAERLDEAALQEIGAAAATAEPPGGAARG